MPAAGAGAVSVADDAGLQKIWLAVERREWRSLAVVSAGGPVDTLAMAQLFARLSWRYSGRPTTLCDLRDLSTRLIDYQVREMKEMVQRGTRLVIALRTLRENPTSEAIARQADATLLCVVLGETDVDGAQQTVAAIGRERIVGSVLVPR